MLDSFKDFSGELYLKHLEEASFLYEQRPGLLDDPELIWIDIEDFEDRFEPPFDGLGCGRGFAFRWMQSSSL